MDRDIPTRWDFQCGATQTAALAHALADINVFKPEHLLPGKNLTAAIENVFNDLCAAARPNPLAALGLTIVPVNINYELRCDWKEYCADRQIEAPVAPLTALVLTCNADGVHDEIIGPTLNALESWPRIGQTVLHILDEGLQRCTGVLSPGTGIGWASHQYWRGELDETLCLEEEFEDTRSWLTDQAQQNGQPAPYDEAVRNYQGEGWFKLADYNADFDPKWHRARKPLKDLPVRLQDLSPHGPVTLANAFLAEELWPKIRAACEQIRRLSRHDTTGDGPRCEGVPWCSVPLMLRLHPDDCLPRILDDVWQDEYNAGENNLEINNLFLWHNPTTLRLAIKRLTNFLTLTQACENLIRLLASQVQPL